MPEHGTKFYHQRLKLTQNSIYVAVDTHNYIIVELLSSRNVQFCGSLEGILIDMQLIIEKNLLRTHFQRLTFWIRHPVLCRRHYGDRQTGDATDGWRTEDQLTLDSESKSRSAADSGAAAPRLSILTLYFSFSNSPIIPLEFRFI